jgi:putative glutamine amidotransferase
LNVAFEGTLITDIPQQVPGALNHRCLDRKDELVHQAELAPDSRLAQITGRSTVGINSSHHQAVGRVAEVFRVVARTSDGIVEAMELAPGAGDLFPYLMSVQYHPERLFDRHPEHRALFLSFTKACGRR